MSQGVRVVPVCGLGLYIPFQMVVHTRGRLGAVAKYLHVSNGEQETQENTESPKMMYTEKKTCVNILIPHLFRHHKSISHPWFYKYPYVLKYLHTLNIYVSFPFLVCIVYIILANS